MNVALWIVQAVLAALFLFAGVMKLIIPIEEMTKETQLPGALLRFIAIAEILGGLGLVLPGAVGIAPHLTPLAAAGLVTIMIGATITSLKMGLAALIPLVVGLLLAWIAYARWRIVPHRP